MTQDSRINLFRTRPHDCSYLPQKQATTLFVDPDAPVDQALYSELSRRGFRRSGPHLYRPFCENCEQCIPARVKVASFKANRNQRRCIKANTDLRVEFRARIDTDEHYALYEQYITLRHQDGDMYPPSRQQFEEFLSAQWHLTQFVEFRDQEQLKAVAVIDELDDGLSAIYTFFDAEDTTRSLGRYAILWQIAEAQRRQLPYVYLGYWIQGCQKMRYKTEYQPCELLIRNHWLSAEPD